ncbi:hypothetical protein NP233_g12579 [Leucocoprinus birnbaumii]|uniref:Septin-type G domain-containing protein n=1 Tax=Leucocoprinus birnbaumii TaxID=56174 RepID=A0AAD5VE93_9AGAR|nr:hypothetical protein NP233_g12579 [Leucocoprinus birnbaumii]
MAASTKEFDLGNVANVAHVESPEELNEADKVIVVMGTAEEDKTKFIRRVKGSVDDNDSDLQLKRLEYETPSLESAIAGRAYAERIKFTGSSADLVLVVAPGFNGTDKTDWEVLLAVARWFNTGKRSDFRLPMMAGVLYHFRTRRNIPPHRSFGDEASLSLLQKLMGEDFYNKTLFVEGVESEEPPPPISSPGEDNECLPGTRTYWEYMETCGSRSCNFDGTLGSAQRIIDSVTQPVARLPNSSTSESERTNGAPLQRLYHEDAEWESISSDYLTENDRVILIMGPPDSGKRNFIQSVLGGKYSDNDLATGKVNALRAKIDVNGDHQLVLVEVPGFDSLHGAPETLDMIICWFKDAGKTPSASSIVVPRISGIIYLRPVGAFRLEEHVVDLNDEMLQRLCGKLFYGKVLLALSTHGADLEEEELRKLQSSHIWRPMTVLGSKVRRFDGTGESARSLIRAVIDAESKSRRQLQQRMMNVQIQKEVVFDGKSRQETKSGQYLEYLGQQTAKGSDYIGLGKLTLRGPALRILKLIIRRLRLRSSTPKGKPHWIHKFIPTDGIGPSHPSLPDFSKRDLDKIDEVVPIDAKQLDANDIIIVIMGPTGSGKSTFIETITGPYFAPKEVGHRLSSATSDVTAIRIKFKFEEPRNLVLVDTPGFGDTYKSDYEILEIIAKWLQSVSTDSSNYLSNTSGHRRISGILYLHRITEPRFRGSALTNFLMFEKLCGPGFASRVRIVTTNWPDERFQDPEELEECEKLEEELQRDYWTRIIMPGVKVHRFHRTSSSAEAVIDEIISAERKELTNNLMIEIQNELVKQRKELPQTKAGRQTLDGPLKEFVKQQNQIIDSLATELGKSTEAASVKVKNLWQELETLQQEIDGLEEDLRKHNISDFRVA